jgi:hypothetical protein
MNLPFTAGQFFEVFARYHAGVWPAPLVLTGLALLALGLVFWPAAAAGRWIAAILALLWAWMALAYHLAYFAAINPAAPLFAALFLLGAIGFAWVGAVRGRLRFAPTRAARGWVGAALLLYALVVYPALGHLLGHRYPALPTFGLPCPTTIFTVGLLMFARSPVPRSVFAVPVLWSLVGATAAFSLGVWQDLGLLAAAAVGLAALIRPSTVFEPSLSDRTPA